MPGQEKIFSTSTAPVRRLAKTRPSTVTTAGSAARGEVARDDQTFGQTFRTRGTHVVVAHHLEDGRPRVAGEEADIEGCKHERGQDEVVQRLHEEPPVTVEQSVDRVETGLVRRGVTPGSSRSAPGNEPSL
jgi:hypothetical protein